MYHTEPDNMYYLCVCWAGGRRVSAGSRGRKVTEDEEERKSKDKWGGEFEEKKQQHTQVGLRE